MRDSTDIHDEISVTSPLVVAEVPESTRPLTRRELRLAERMEADDSFGSADFTTVSLTPVAPPAVRRRDLRDAEVISRRELRDAEVTSRRELRDAEVTSRRELRDAEISSRRELRDTSRHAPLKKELELAARHVSPGHSTRTMPRAALVGSLGLATIAVPVTGFAAVQQPAAVANPIASETSYLDILEGAAANAELNGKIPTATSLANEPLARVLANDLASRNLERTVISACEPVTLSATGLSDANTVVVSPLIRPMAAGTYRNTSAYGPRWGSFHAGTDMAAPIGTPLYAVADGVVVHAGAGRDGRSGQLVIIKSTVGGRNVWFWYGHMYPSGVYVRTGQSVRAGQIIGGVGNSGFSTGPHLHFEVHVGSWNNHVSPLGWLRNNGAVFPGQC